MKLWNLRKLLLVVPFLAAMMSSLALANEYKVDLKCNTKGGETFFVLEDKDGKHSVWWRGASLNISDYFNQSGDRSILIESRSFVMSIDRKKMRDLRIRLSSNRNTASSLDYVRDKVFKAELQFKKLGAKALPMRCYGYIQSDRLRRSDS